MKSVFRIVLTFFPLSIIIIGQNISRYTRRSKHFRSIDNILWFDIVRWFITV